MLIACRINDSVMELLIMISACKGGSAKSVTGIEALIGDPTIY
jgi:phosphoribosylpyrophosphate synthetase